MDAVPRDARTVPRPAPAIPVPARRRDDRVDFFRGLSLIFIFIDHVPENLLANFTLNAFSFSDAASVFVFIAGYAAAYAYGGMAERRGMVFASARIWRRAWQLYIAHIVLFVLLTAQVSYVVRTFDNPMYFDELGVGVFIEQPHVLIVEALALRYQPRFLDILPLYIVLLLGFPLALWAVRRHWLMALLPSLALYLFVQVTKFNFRTFPDESVWTFNPLAWQLLIVSGVVCGHLTREGRLRLPRGRWVLPFLAAFTAVTVAIRFSWTLHGLWEPIPGLFMRTVMPMVGKTDLAPLRVVQFLLLVWLVAITVRPDARWLRSRPARPVLLCGKHSLEIFCLGILLSVLGHLFLVEYGSDIGTQFAVNFGGLILMAATAYLLEWYSSGDRDMRRT